MEMFDKLKQWWRRRYVLLNTVETLLSFRPPGHPSRREIQTLLGQMTPLPWPEVRTSYRRAADALVYASLDDLLEELFRVLCAHSEAMSKDWFPPRRWHYEVVRSDEHPQCLNVHTVLTTDGRPGSIRYGREIRRLTVDEFAMWVDD